MTSSEPLPFPPDYFDFILRVRFTYHLPEDEVCNSAYSWEAYPDAVIHQGLDITRVRVRCVPDKLY